MEIRCKLGKSGARLVNFQPSDWLNGAKLRLINLAPTNTVNEFVSEVIYHLMFGASS